MDLRIIGYWGAYPGPGEATSCYLLQAGQSSILLDCGSGALSLLQRVLDPAKLTGVVLSHYHADHMADIHCLQYAARVDMELGRRKKPLPIYGHTQDPSFASLTYKEFTMGIEYGADSVVRMGEFVLRFFPTIHPDPCFAVRVEWEGRTVAYSGDAEYSDDLAGFVTGADLFLCESSLYEQFRGKIPGHMSAGEAGMTARKGNVGSLILTHLPHYGSHPLLLEQARAEFTGPTTLAESGMSRSL